MILFLNILFLFVVVLLGGCVAMPSMPDLDVDNESLGLLHQKQLALLESWEFKGRVAIKGGKQNGSAFLLWHQHQNRFDLRLSGPLGRQVMHAWGDEQGVSVDLPKQKTIQVKNISELIDQNTGWQIPVNHFRYWVKGAFAPGDFSGYQMDTKGRLKELNQAGWNIVFKRYLTVNHVDLPGKIYLSREPYELRMVINHWKFNE